LFEIFSAHLIAKIIEVLHHILLIKSQLILSVNLLEDFFHLLVMILVFFLQLFTIFFLEFVDEIIEFDYLIVCGDDLSVLTTFNEVLDTSLNSCFYLEVWKKLMGC
jgi:hypothetical protein